MSENDPKKALAEIFIGLCLKKLVELGKVERTVSTESNNNYLIPSMKIRDFTFTSLSDAV